MRVRAFDADLDSEQWDAFCAKSLCSSFLPTRKFLSYHGDRFEDASLVLESDAGDWLGILPAARDPSDSDCIVSHPGITFGGIVHAGKLRGEQMLQALSKCWTYYTDTGCRRFIYKALPHIYHRVPSADDSYALFRLGANRVRCDLSCVVDLAHRGPVSQRRKRGVKKAIAAGVCIEEGPHLVSELWPVLCENLARRHDVTPTHSAVEIAELADRFPDQILFCGARLEGTIEAGIVIFACDRVHHLQYLASSERANELGALEHVVEHAIARAGQTPARWFDFGISTAVQGTELNDGLYTFKREFGGGGLVHEFYELEAC